MEKLILQTMAILPFHIICDWLFQGYEVAMNKAQDWAVRTYHVCYYSLIMSCFISCTFEQPIPNPLQLFFFLAIPHWFIDTYKPVYWWCKYIHGDPNAATINKFAASFKNPRQLLMYVVLDQTFHFLTLLPVVHWVTHLKPS